MNPTTSTLSTILSSDARPRSRRPHTSNHEAAGSRSDDWDSTSSVISPFASPHPSRATSPLTQQRLAPYGGSNSVRQTTTFGNVIPRDESTPRSSQKPMPLLGSGLWGHSWSAIQGLASTVLGSESIERFKGQTNPAIRPPSRRSSSEGRNRWLNSHAGPVQWGPQPNVKKSTDYIAAGSRESREALVRAKRRENLLVANNHASADNSGNVKRRMSDVRDPSSSASPTDNEGESLVYLHHVKPHDTVAGVIIQFSCNPAVFKKVNRLWPNDPIQCRQTVVLPVDACGVKGRLVTKDLESSSLPLEDSTEQGAAQSLAPSHFLNPREGDAQSSAADEDHERTSWKHESWVHIEGQPCPVEVVRLPRKTLGFFPPRRRRSASSEIDGVTKSSDLVGRREDRSRRGNSGSGSTSYFAQHLHGPGGVGTLDAGIRSPGPGQDGLNRYLAPHLPSVEPRDSFESVGSNVSTGLENVGSAIEGWVKKVANRAAAIVETSGSMNGSRRSRQGDLIELSDGLEGPDDGTPKVAGARVGSSAQEDMERALRERFPMRGRVGDEARRKKGD